MTKPRALLLDFGGVLYRVDFARWDRELAAIASTRGRERLREGGVAPLNHAIEAARLDPAAFRVALRELLEATVDDASLDAAWNSLLGGVIEGAAEAVRSLAEDHRLFLVSNSNAIHLAYLEADAASLWPSFEKRYFSHRLGTRKPAPAFYERVLADAGLDPSECLFVDDSPENVDAARSLGLPSLAWERNAPPARLITAVRAPE